MSKMIKSNSTIFASLALICFATGATAGVPNTTVSMELIGPTSGSNSPNLGGEYTDPYLAIIGAPGQTQPVINGVVTQVICDDFLTDVSTDTPPWQAFVTSLNSILTESTTSSLLKFDTTGSVIQQQTDYDVAAYLAIEISNTDQSGAAGQLTAEELSYALWTVFEPVTLTDPFLTPAQVNAITADLTQAENFVKDGWTPTGYNVNIYTPNPVDASQEYITVSVSAPEASTSVLLAADLLGLFAMVGFLRRRALQKV